MTPEDFLKNLTGEAKAYAENLQGQRDSSLADLTAEQSAHEATKAKAKEDADATAKAHEEALATLQTQLDTSDQQIAELSGKVESLTAERGTLSEKLTAAEATVKEQAEIIGVLEDETVKGQERVKARKIAAAEAEAVAVQEKLKLLKGGAVAAEVAE